MNRQTDPEPVAPFHTAAALPINQDLRVDLDAAGEDPRIPRPVPSGLRSSAASPDAGCGPWRAPGARREPSDGCRRHSCQRTSCRTYWTELALRRRQPLVRELSAARAVELLDDVDSHAVADILRESPGAEAFAIIAELHRPHRVVSLLQYPPDTAGGMLNQIFCASDGGSPRAMLPMRCGCAARTPRVLVGFAYWMMNAARRRGQHHPDRVHRWVRITDISRRGGFPCGHWDDGLG